MVGLDECRVVFSGAAMISTDLKRYFARFGIDLMEVIALFTRWFVSGWSSGWRVVNCDEPVTELLVRSHDKALRSFNFFAIYFVLRHWSCFLAFFYRLFAPKVLGLIPHGVASIFLFFNFLTGSWFLKFLFILNNFSKYFSCFLKVLVPVHTMRFFCAEKSPTNHVVKLYPNCTIFPPVHISQL